MIETEEIAISGNARKKLDKIVKPRVKNALLGVEKMLSSQGMTGDESIRDSAKILLHLYLKEIFRSGENLRK